MTQGLFDAQSVLLNAGAAFFDSEQARLLDDAPSLAAICEKAADVCGELLLITTADDATYERREATLTALSNQYGAFCTQRLETRLAALQYNGVEIDTELIRIFLFGQNLLVSPNA